MSNDTYWNIKKREWASREQRTTRGPRRRRNANTPLATAQKADVQAPDSVVVVEPIEAQAPDVEVSEYQSIEKIEKETRPKGKSRAKESDEL